MREPITTLDPRFSNSDGVVTSWEETQRLLEAAQLFWLTTVRADGRPHVTPLVAIWHDGALYFSTGVGEQKAINLRGDTHVALTTGDNRWQDGIDVVIEGDAVRISDDDALKRLAEVWTSRWDGRWNYAVRDGYFHHRAADGQPDLSETILVFAVQPTKVFAFGKGVFSHTRHQF